MSRCYLAVILAFSCMFWTVDALARGRGYGSGGEGGFGLGIIIIGAIGYGVYGIHRLFPWLGPSLLSIVVIFGVSNFFAVVLRDMGVVEAEDEVLTTLVLPFIAWGAYLLYCKLR